MELDPDDVFRDDDEESDNEFYQVPFLRFLFAFISKRLLSFVCFLNSSFLFI